MTQQTPTLHKLQPTDRMLGWMEAVVGLAVLVRVVVMVWLAQAYQAKQAVVERQRIRISRKKTSELKGGRGVRGGRGGELGEGGEEFVA